MANLSAKNKVPPHSLETENMVIGAMLMQSQAIPKVAEVLKPECFYSPLNNIIYSAILNLYVANESVDVVSVYEELKKDGKTHEGLDIGLLSSLTESTSSRANIDFHTRLILEKWILRKLIETSSDIIGEAYEGKKDVFEIVEQSEKAIFDVTQTAFRKDGEHIKVINQRTMDHLEKIKHHGIDGHALSTGLYDLDEILGGLRRAESIIIAGRPSMGKTALALNIAEFVAESTPVAFFSLEMSSHLLSMRQLASRSGVDSRKMQRGTFSDQDAAKLLRASQLDLNLYIDDTPGLHVIEWKSKARRFKAEKNVGLIVIDYLQLMTGEGKSRELEISMISRTIKNTAKELDIPIIALSQMNRSVEARTNKRPQMSDLRESGAIEQDADVVAFVHRPEYYGVTNNEDGSSTEGIAEIILGKNRNYGVGDCKLLFRKELTKFENLARFGEI